MRGYSICNYIYEEADGSIVNIKTHVQELTRNTITRNQDKLIH